MNVSSSELPFRLPLALIFDLDGVLVDSEPLHQRAKEQAFAEFGIVLEQSDYDDIKGRPDEATLREILEARGVPHVLAELTERKRAFFQAIQHELQAVVGAVEFIHWARQRFCIALATSSTSRNRDLAFGVLGVGDHFESVVDAGRHRIPKPNPEVFEVAMADLRLKPEDCWIIEDSINGIRAAKAAGCVTVGITTTFGRAKLQKAGADLVVDSFEELRGILARLSD
ncbi:MAG TPA: HAD family phosphatase [Candidatus Solibacter sp.]|nr:HAD family phosphatase [Candidatus Solibacter sp.]